MFSTKPIEAETSGNATLRENGTGCGSTELAEVRAAALPKMLTPFEGAHLLREVSILENLGDSFEDAHPFPRCSPDLLASIINEHAYVSKNGIKAEARRRATLRESGTGSGSTVFDPEAQTRRELAEVRAVPWGLDRSRCRNEAY